MTDQVLIQRIVITPPLATDARTADGNTRCALCGRPVWRGRDRIATLPAGTHGHVSCIARAAERTA